MTPRELVRVPRRILDGWDELHRRRHRLTSPDEAELGIVRRGQAIAATVQLVPAVEDPPRDARDLTGRHPLVGAKVANLSPAVAEELGIEDDGPGVVVIEVAPNTPAARLGVKRGDLVIGLNSDKVTSVAGLVKALGAPADGWRLSLQREGQVYNLAIQG